MKITAYPLYGPAVTVQPSPEGRGWDFLCPCAFEAIWNGGPGAGDVEIRLAEDPGKVEFVQSLEGNGLLTFYPGYQCRTEAEHALWVRGPINASKDGAVALESVIDTSIVPGTLILHWRLTRPGQTLRFTAGEPFCTILPYPKAGLDEVTVEVTQLTGGVDNYERALESLAGSEALESVFQRLAAAGTAAGGTPPMGGAAKSRVAGPGGQVDSEHPGVSCICLTYARPEVLEEAIHSFLQQDYVGPKELIVLNDYDRQILELDHPEVLVVNLPKRLRTVGEKMNLAVSLATHDLLFVWDDDDVYLPHRLTLSVAKLEPRHGFFKPDKAWFWNSGTLGGPAKNVFHSGSCWTRRLFDEVGGYPAEGSGYDLVFEHRLEQRFPGAITAYDIRPEDIYYIYRWSGTGSYHMSGYGEYAPGANAGHEQVAAYVQRRAAEGGIRHGRIRLRPHWNDDYRRLVAECLRSRPENEAEAVE